MSNEYPVTEFESKSEFIGWLNSFNNQTKQPKVKLESVNSCYQLTCEESKSNCANVMFCNDGRVEVRFW